MKKKFRDITVDGVKYAWQATAVNGGDILLKIWLNKKIIFEKEVFGDIDTLEVAVKPSFVANVIKEIR